MTVFQVYLTLYAKWVIPPGTAQWARSVTFGTNESTFTGITSDSSGHVYAVGTQGGNSSYTYGSESVTGGSTSINTVIVKYAR